MSWLSKLEREQVERGVEWEERGKCFFCGGESIGSKHCGSLGEWFVFCAKHSPNKRSEFWWSKWMSLIERANGVGLK